MAGVIIPCNNGWGVILFDNGCGDYLLQILQLPNLWMFQEGVVDIKFAATVSPKNQVVERVIKTITITVGALRA